MSISFGDTWAVRRTPAGRLRSLKSDFKIREGLGFRIQSLCLNMYINSPSLSLSLSLSLSVSWSIAKSIHQYPYPYRYVLPDLYLCNTHKHISINLSTHFSCLLLQITGSRSGNLSCFWERHAHQKAKLRYILMMMMTRNDLLTFLSIREPNSRPREAKTNNYNAEPKTHKLVNKIQL